MTVDSKLLRKAVLIATLIAATAAIAPVAAQQYPTKPIRLLIPSPPGGGTDTLGRLFKEGFSEL